MELKAIAKNLTKHSVVLFISAAAGVLLGYLFYLAPKPYYATGSFYVKRMVDTAPATYFGYEGYYGQQAALSYTNTVLALFDSTDIKYAALIRIGLPTDIDSLKKYSAKIVTKKTGPQLITLTVKETTPQKAEALWGSVSYTAMKKSSLLNKTGDPLLSIAKVTDIPIVTVQYRPLWVCLILGFVLLPILAISYLSLRDYFK